MVSALFTTDGQYPVEKNKQARIPISGDPEALDGLAAIILLTTSSVTVPAKSPTVSSQRCDLITWYPGTEWSFDDCTEYPVSSSITVWKRSATGAHLRGHLLGEALPDFMFWAKPMSPLLCTLGTVSCVTGLSVHCHSSACLSPPCTGASPGVGTGP